MAMALRRQLTYVTSPPPLSSPPLVVVTDGQSYPLCLPALLFLQSPNVAFTCLCAPLVAALAPRTGDPTTRETLARRVAPTRFAVRLRVVEPCIISGDSLSRPAARVDDLESRQPGYLTRGRDPKLCVPASQRVCPERSARAWVIGARGVLLTPDAAG